MKITIHRGIRQIGGCITEIKSENGTKILIDLGHNLPEGDKPSEDIYDKPEKLDELLEGVNAVFYTHPHGDHLSFEAKVEEAGIPQYIGKASKAMLLVLKGHQAYSAKGERKEVSQKSYDAIESFREYDANETIEIGAIRVTPYFVSHSAADAYMFVVECDERRILHTGDFRDHGYRGKGLLPTIATYITRRKMDVLITEGTMLSRNDSRVQSEEELKESAIKLMKRYDNVFVMCSSMDADRISSFYFANKEFKSRPFVVDGYQYIQMKTMRDTLGADPKGWRYRFGGQLYYNKHKEEIQKSIPHKGVTVLLRNNYQMRKMIDELYPLMNPERTCLVYSQFRGYVLKEHKAFQQRIYDFIHSKDWHIEYLHTSGHASREALAAVCEKVNPRYAIIPIHRDAESDFRSLPISQELKDKVLTETPNEAIGGIDVVIR
ncbi:MAG: MBL fold metallo-hydrolase [Bacteroidaceae bacterium]|nr:MBL fold metallo-hydrolase [Bacteroidaceae bacterium]